MSDPGIHRWFQATMPQLAGKRRVELLKALEAATADLFVTEPAFEAQRNALGEGRADMVRQAALQQQWTGIKEYSEVGWQAALAWRGGCVQLGVAAVCLLLCQCNYSWHRWFRTSD